MANVHPIGEPENSSERRAIRKLAERLPDGYHLFHNFELTTGRGLPYEYDLAVVGDIAVWHVEVKGYNGAIRGDARHWMFENGGVTPSPIPLANRKSKILSSRLASHSPRLRRVWVDTMILLTDDRARVLLRDEQASRVVLLGDAVEHLTDSRRIPVQVDSIEPHHDLICEALSGSRPNKKLKQIGLYDVVERINQTESRTVFLTKHRFIRTRPKTILKVFHFDMYASEDERRLQIEAIFHDQDAMRLIGVHPNIIDTGDMFAWGHDKFVLPTEYVDRGRPLLSLLEEGDDREIPWAEKADWIAKMARGLRHVHQHGVIMRDVRPLNVVVAPGGVVKLVNFDLAFLQESPELSSPKGLDERLDPAYVAPEVWRNPAKADARSDIYSLGIVFYQLITSQLPYRHIEDVVASGAETPLDTDLLLSELITPGSEDFMSSPRDAVDVIARMCRQDPSERYASLDEVLDDLSILE